MTEFNQLKQQLREYITEKLKYSIPLRVAKGTAVLGGIIGTSTAINKSLDAYIKRKKKKEKLKKQLKSSKVHEAKKEVVGGIWKHRKMLAKTFGKGAAGAAAWTTAERALTTRSAIRKERARIRALAKLHPEKKK